MDFAKSFKRVLFEPWFISFILLVLCLTLTDCVKKPAARDEDGPEAQKEDIAAATMDGLGDLDFTKTKKGDFVFFETEQSVRGSDAINPMSGSAVTVRARAEDNEIVAFGLTQENITYNGDGTSDRIVKDIDNCGAIKPKSTTAEFVQESLMRSLEFKVQTSTMGSRQLHTNSSNFFCMNEPLPEPTPEPEETTTPTQRPSITYHNLSVERKQVPPPDLVVQSANCGGVPNCILNATLIKYDVLVKQGDQRERISVRQMFSQDVPLVPIFNPNTSKELNTVSRIIESCTQMSIPVKDKDGQEQRVLVTQCDRLKNFKIGTD